MLELNRTRGMLNCLERYRYATLEHALIAALWETSIRIGAARGLDVDDYDADG